MKFAHLLHLCLHLCFLWMIFLEVSSLEDERNNSNVLISTISPSGLSKPIANRTSTPNGSQSSLDERYSSDDSDSIVNSLSEKQRTSKNGLANEIQISPKVQNYDESNLSRLTVNDNDHMDYLNEYDYLEHNKQKEEEEEYNYYDGFRNNNTLDSFTGVSATDFIVSTYFTDTATVGSCPSGDCTQFDMNLYKNKVLTPTNFNFLEEMVSYVDNSVCDGSLGLKPIAIESQEELTLLVTCSFCSDLSFFASFPKNHILTSGVVNTTATYSEFTPSEALEYYGYWRSWESDTTQHIPLEVVLLDFATGVEMPAGTSVPPGVYSVILLGTKTDHCEDGADLGSCTYWKWGLITQAAGKNAIQDITFTICEEESVQPTTSTTKSSTTSSTTLSTTPSTTTTTTTTTPPSTTFSTTTSSTTPSTISSTEASTTTTSTTLSTTTSIPSATTTPSTTTIFSSTESTTSTVVVDPDLSTTSTEFLVTTSKIDHCCTVEMMAPLTVCDRAEIPCLHDGYIGWEVVECTVEDGLVRIEDHCVRKWIEDVKDMIESGNYTAVDISVEVRSSTNFNDSLTANDLENLIGVLENLTALAARQMDSFDEEERRDFLIDYDDNFVHITSNIFSVPITWSRLDNAHAGRFGESILQNMEVSGFLLADQLVKEVIHFNSSEVNMTVAATPRSAAEGRDLFIPNSENPTFLHLPQNFEGLLAENDTNVKLVNFVVKQKSAHRTLPAVLNGKDIPNGIYKEINSALVSASIGKAGHYLNFTLLGDGVTLRFRHSFPEAGALTRKLYRERRPGETPTPVPNTATCVYWDTTRNLWSPDGCHLVNTSLDVTYCKCHHLTMFAIITDIHHYVGRDPVLDILGTVLSAISCLSLFIAFAVFQFYKSLASPRIAITKQLCFSLGVTQLLLLLLLDRDYLKQSETLCSASAAVLHYWLSASIFWMLVEGLHLFQTVSDVLSHVSYMPAYWMLGYGVPVVLVVTTLLVAYSLGQWSSQDAYAPPLSEYCWLSTENGYIWSFTGPLIAVIILNTLSMIFALRSAATLRTNRQKTLPEQIRLWVKGSFSLNCILGTTWVFGFLYINTSHVFAYIFTALNASQGIMILLFNCIINDTVRTAIVKSLPDCLSGQLKKQKKKKTQPPNHGTTGITSRDHATSFRQIVRNINSAFTLSTSASTSISSSPSSTPPSYPLQRKRVSPSSAEAWSSRPYKNGRYGSQMSNSTQMTFVIDNFGDYNSPGSVRRTSLDSCSSSNSSLSTFEDRGFIMYPGDLPVSFSSPITSSSRGKSCDKGFYNAENPRYIPGFGAIQECDERSPRPEQKQCKFFP